VQTDNADDDDRISRLEHTIRDRDELIDRLEAEIAEHCCDTTTTTTALAAAAAASSVNSSSKCVAHDRRKDRSQSLAVSTDRMAMCQRAANKFQCLVNQMTERRADKKASKSAEMLDNHPTSSSSSGSSSRHKSPTTTTTSQIDRSKSPTLLSRLRDRSPAKAQSPIAEPSTSSSARSLLSPNDAERPIQYDERRRSSPSRPLFSRSKQLQNTPKPAWKF